MDQIESIVREVLSRLNTDAPREGACPQGPDIPAEMSARHVHLTPEDLKALFGKDTLECVREISQPGQFLSDCRVRLIGPKGILDNVAVLGPTRSATQVEISSTDARALGLSAPVRLSGDLKDAAQVTIMAGNCVITRKAAIVARRHLHMTPRDAAAFGLRDGDSVNVKVLGSRPLILEEVPVRVTEQSALALHMDTDEANAAGAGKDCRCRIVGTCAPSVCSGTSACSADAAPGAPQESGCLSLPGKLITEHDIRALKGRDVKCLRVAAGQIITPLARDTAKSMGIALTYGG